VIGREDPLTAGNGYTMNVEVLSNIMTNKKTETENTRTRKIEGIEVHPGASHPGAILLVDHLSLSR
jgi:hypothetical protein